MDSQSELDNHADTCAVGDNDLITHDFDLSVSVSSYDKSVYRTEACTATALLAHDDPLAGAVALLIFHQAMHIPGLRQNLLCPRQMQMNGIQVSENPKFLTARLIDHYHALFLPDQTGDFDTGNTRYIENGDINRGTYLIPLTLHGVTSYLPTRKSTIAEANCPSNRSFEVTYDYPEWDTTCH